MGTHTVETDRLTFRQIAPTFAAEVLGMAIDAGVSPDLLSSFVSLLHRYRVLVVPNVTAEPSDLVGFSRRFGPLEIHSRFENTLPAHRGNLLRRQCRA